MNGLNATHDLRFTASLCMIFRIVVMLSYIGCNSTFASCESVLVFMWVFLLLLFFALVRPYKDQYKNVLDSFLLAGLSLICLLFTTTSQCTEHKTFNEFVLTIIIVIITIPQAVLSYLQSPKQTHMLQSLCQVHA